MLLLTCIHWFMRFSWLKFVHECSFMAVHFCGYLQVELMEVLLTFWRTWARHLVRMQPLVKSA